MPEPVSSSTPHRIPRKREGIHDMISPLPAAQSAVTGIPESVKSNPLDVDIGTPDSSNHSEYTDESDSSEVRDDDSETGDDLPDNKEIKTSIGNLNNTAYFCIVAIVSVLLACILFTRYSESSTDFTVSITMNDIQSKFPQQSKDFWLYLQSGISEVAMLNKPSVFIFLYKEGTENMVEELIKDISTYASCILNNNCTISAVTLSDEQLNSLELMGDYGEVINKYKPELEKRHIMVIKNLDKISCYVAQAFHSFCDEYTPQVGRSLFFFTIKVDTFYDDNLNQVLKILRAKWKDLDMEKLEPLLTRITSTVLGIISEREL